MYLPLSTTDRGPDSEDAATERSEGASAERPEARERPNCRKRPPAGRPGSRPAQADHREAPPDADAVAYSDHERYWCRHCGEECINPADAPATATRQCWRCWRIPALEEAGSR